VYTQVHVRADGGFKVREHRDLLLPPYLFSQTLSTEKAGKLAGDNPDYGIQDLFESIEKGQYPSWTVYVQTMTPEQAEKFRYNVLDLTKVGICLATLHGDR
jgi:catalase